MTTLNFVLAGRDHLSRVLDRAGDSADRLGRRLLAASINGDAAVRRLANSTTRSLSQMQRDTDAGGKALEELRKTTLLLSPAAIPAAASLAPIAAGAGAVAIASLAMGAALIPQISALGEASEAQQKYEDAVTASGARSQEAIKAHAEYVRVVSELPPKTREAAAAVGILKDDFADWSDSLSGATMEPFIKGVSIANALLPKTRGLVKGTAGEADRFMTIIGGEMASPGLDRLNAKFTAFTQKTLRSMNDEFVHLLRISDSGQIGAGASQFMDWARAQGPAVGAILRDIATALVHVLDAGSDVGVGLLQVVGVLADVAAAVPPSAIALILQLAVALKLTKAAALGLVAGRTALAGFAAQILAMNTAAAAAPTRLAAVRAGIAALSRTTKVAMAGTGIGLLLIALSELSARSASAPPDVDKLTSSLRQLGSTGKVTGEAAKHFGSDLGGLFDKVRAATDPGKADQVQQWVVSLGGLADWDSTPVKDAKENIDAIDKALAGLVQNGQADLAAAALKRLTAEYGKGGRDTSELTGRLDDYKSAIADAKFEQQLAAESMGLFGAQAQKTQTALAEQKASADGLRQSIQALNDVQRAGLGGMIGFEAAIDAAGKAASKNAGALSMTNGELNLGSEKARTAATALQDLASKTDEATASARESGASWETVNGIYTRGREAFIRNAQAMGLSKTEAAQLADQIMRIPDKTATVSMRTEDAEVSLGRVIAAMKKAPDSKSVTVKALTNDAVDLLRELGFKVTRLKDGRFKVSADTANAKGNIAAVQRARDALKNKTIDLAARDRASAAARAIQRAIAALRSKTVTITTVRATIATYNTVGRPARGEGGVSKYASGGTPEAGEMAMVGENGPELVVFGEAARVFDATTTQTLLRGTLGAGRAASQGLAAGLTGAGGGVYAASRSIAAQVTAGIREELQIASPSKKTKALMADVGKGMITGLTGSQAKIKATAKDLAKDIYAAFSGSKDNRLVAYVNKQTAKLTAAAKKRDSIAATIKRATEFAETTRVGAKQSASLSSMFSGDEEAVTATGISQKLQAKLAKMKTFTSYINTLAKKGLNKTMLREILTMGPDEGYAYASALVGANSTLFKQINSTQYAVNAQAEKLGNAGADALYDSGKNASKGFLAGLKSQQKDLEKYMLSIAKSMQKTLKKALGIKSPSRVMAALGVFSTRGLADGLLEGLPHVDRAMTAVAGRVAAAPVVGRPAVVASAGSGAAPQIHVTVNGAIDPYSTAREIEKVLAKYRRGRGGAGYSFA
ncbi:hypothetical protein [Streptomyces sp. NPDC059786]|uniref:hypothetical protein n=1 Tax=Streptomyces sp. NPDC059786 TaxID=3346946 RepID=UPI00365709CB